MLIFYIQSSETSSVESIGEVNVCSNLKYCRYSVELEEAHISRSLYKQQYHAVGIKPKYCNIQQA